MLCKFVRYINKVYGVAMYAHRIRDTKKRRSIKTAVVVYLLIFAFALRVSSFCEMMCMLQYNKHRFQNLLPKNSRLPKIDALRDTVKAMDCGDILGMYNGIIDTLTENIKGDGVQQIGMKRETLRSVVVAARVAGA